MMSRRQPIEYHRYRRKARPQEVREAACLNRNTMVQNDGGMMFMARKGDYLVRVGHRLQRVRGDWFEQIYDRVEN